MRQQLRNITRPLRRQAREDVLQISIRIMPIEPRRLDQAHDRRRPFAAAQRTCKEPVFTTQRLRSDLVVAPIIVNGYGPVIEIARQRRPAFEAVIQSFVYRRAVVHDLALGDHPGMQSIHHRYSFFLPYSAA
jgi:hypothetical protein